MMFKRKFPNEEESHKRALAHQPLPSIEPVKKKIQFSVKSIDLGEMSKNTIHIYSLKKKN